MEVLYISAMFDYVTYENLFDQAVKPMHAANKYHTLLTKGLGENGVKVKAYSVLPINGECCKRKYVRVKPIREGNCEFGYIAMFNMPGIRNIQAMAKAFFRALFAPKDTVIVFDALVVSASIGAVLGTKLSGKKSICIVTDMPEFMPIAASPKMLAINNQLMEAADGYIFLTEQMNPKINRNNRPYTIVEGLVDESMKTRIHRPFAEPRKLIYAGSLERIYGIEHLCRAYLACQDIHSQLHIYGDGDFAQELQQLAQNHENICYHGNVVNEKVVKAELDAALLVNPRPSEGEYTKYSFPSKTLEYMVSGTPVLTAKLPGIPESYYEHLLFFEEAEGGLEAALKEALSCDLDTLETLGAKARQFALKEKNNLAQAKKVMDLICRVMQ